MEGREWSSGGRAADPVEEAVRIILGARERVIYLLETGRLEEELLRAAGLLESARGPGELLRAAELLRLLAGFAHGVSLRIRRYGARRLMSDADYIDGVLAEVLELVYASGRVSRPAPP